MRFAPPAWLFAFAIASNVVRAQQLPVPAAVFRDGAQFEIALPPTSPIAPAPAPGNLRSPWYAPLASLVLPGSGQAIMRQQRAVGYLVAETFLLIGVAKAHRDANSARTEYRRLASEVARASFGTDRPNGKWDYYEVVEENTASGEYNLATSGVFMPEVDLSTYNGKQWLQARQTYWLNPDVAPATGSVEYQNALKFYQDRAFQGSFRWSWRNHQLEQDSYIQSINEANLSQQRLVQATGLVVANALVSMVDAYINVRVRRYGGAGLSSLSVKTKISPDGAVGLGYRASITASVLAPKW